MSKKIRVEGDTHAALAALKGDDGTFDELLSRLLRERRETIRGGPMPRSANRYEARDRNPMTVYDSSVLIDYLNGDDAVE